MRWCQWSSGARARLVMGVGEPPYRGVPHPPTVPHLSADLPQTNTMTYGVTFRTFPQLSRKRPSASKNNHLRQTFPHLPATFPQTFRRFMIGHCDRRRAPVSSPPRRHTDCLSRRPSTGLRSSPRHSGSSAVALSTRPDRSSRSIAAVKAPALVRRPSGIRVNSFGA